MQFREFAENLLGSRVKIKIIRRLLTDETLTSERELAKLVGASPGAVNRVLKEFHECNLILPMRVGTATVWTLNKGSYAYSFLTDFQSKIKENPLEDLKDSLRSWFIRSEAKKIVLFGSVAEGNEKPSSDIDLFLLVADTSKQKFMSDLARDYNHYFVQRYGNNLSANILTEKDLTDPKNKKFLESVSRGIVIGEIV
ncbi:MAG: nucleotidyltransferase domain-containing protein [Candidatus Micrarchaeota archaeon]